MADLPTALAAMFSGGDVTIFKATVDAVNDGLLTIHADGGSFTDVPYLVGGWPFTSPGIGDITYVIGRRGWGMLAIGVPAPSDRAPVGDSQVVEWNPYARARWNRAQGTWTVPPLDEMAISPGDHDAVYFFNRSDLVWAIDDQVGTISFYLSLGQADMGGEAFDNNYVNVGLHNTTAPNTSLAKLANLEATYKLPTIGRAGYVSVPLDWAARLINGSAKGIWVGDPSFPTPVRGPGTIRLTSL